MTDNPLTDTVRLQRRNAGALPKGEPKIKEATMKKRFLALLLAVCIGVSVLGLPASAAGSNTAVQTAVTLGAFSTEEAAGLSTPLTRGQLAKLLVAFSAYHDNANTQGSIGTLYTDVNGSSAYAPYIRIAVQQGWMSGYTDGSFRPDNTVTLEEACTAALTLLGYDITTLTGGFPAAQLNKANAIGLRSNLGCTQGQTMTLEEGAVLLYNALTANTADGSVYGTTLGYTVTNGQVDVSSILLSSLEGPFVASEGESLPFVPEAIYRNGSVSTSAQLSAYDVYYYNASAKTVWIYTRKAAGRITAVSPSASAPTSVTVAGTSYTIASSSAAAQLSSLNGGGVGQVVTLLLGMNNEAVAVLTGDEADEVFYGVVQTAARSLVEENGADVRQAVAVKCTDGVTRTVNVDKSLNYPAGWMVKITVNAEGEQVETITKTSTSGTINADSTALGGTALADDVEILDTTSEGVAGTVSPSRLSGVTLSDADVRYYTTNENGQIDRLILNDVTGDLWTYGVLDDVKNLINNTTTTTSGTTSSGMTVSTAIKKLTGNDSTTGTTGSSTTTTTTDDSQIISDVADIVLPSTGDLLWGLVDGSIGSSLWESVTGSTDKLASYLLKLGANNTSGSLSTVLNYLGSGADYVCYVNGKQTTYKTSTKYPVLAGGIAIGTSTSGTVKSMTQLLPVVIDKVGAASVMSGNKKYETADEMQVYLWYKGTYYPTTLSQVNGEEYTLIGWYDGGLRAAGGKIRVLIAVRKN